MAKQGKIEREKKIADLIVKYRDRRTELRNIKKDKSLSMKDRIKASFELDNLPRSSVRIRARNRCALTHRPRGFSRFFGLGRHGVKLLASQGRLPGVRRASW